MNEKKTFCFLRIRFIPLTDQPKSAKNPAILLDKTAFWSMTEIVCIELLKK